MLGIFPAGYISAKQLVLMKNYNHVSESTEQEMAVPLKSDSLKIFETLSHKNFNISKNAYQ